MILHISKENWRGFINMRQMLDASTGANNTYHKKIEHGDIFYISLQWTNKSCIILPHKLNFI